MLEFGSDFHRCDQDCHGESNYFDLLGCTRLYACGRHAITAIINQEGWNRVWMPAFFCYEVIEHIRNTGVEIAYYDDSPLCENDGEIVRSLPYREGDVLLRTQYFGLRGKRTNKGIPVPVIEDHTHDLISEWALESDAEWCIASLRKILPVAAGGILWSPKGKQMPDSIQSTVDCERMAKIRYEAMSMKAQYLCSQAATKGDKMLFREKYIASEEMIDNLSTSGIDRKSWEITKDMDIKRWIDFKRDNWETAVKMLDKRIRILGAEINTCWHPFSLTVLMNSPEEREKIRAYMIQHSIYPAILWRIPEDCHFAEAKDFSGRMLSIHCDMRYNQKEISQMCELINGYYDTDI